MKNDNYGLWEVIAVAGALAALYYFSSYVISLWIPLLIIGLLVFVGHGFYQHHESERNAKALAALSSKWDEPGGHQQRDLTACLHDLVMGCLVIDTDIWMDIGYDPFFKALKAVCMSERCHLLLPAIQLAAINNLVSVSPAGSKHHVGAILALSRIEDLQKSRCLKVDKESFSKEVVPADQVLSTILLAYAGQYPDVSCMTRDPETRRRIQGGLGDVGCTKVRFVDVEVELVLTPFPPRV